MKEDFSTLTAEVPIVVHVFFNKVDLGNSLIKVRYQVLVRWTVADARLD